MNDLLIFIFCASTFYTVTTAFSLSCYLYYSYWGKKCSCNDIEIEKGSGEPVKIHDCFFPIYNAGAVFEEDLLGKASKKKKRYYQEMDGYFNRHGTFTVRIDKKLFTVSEKEIFHKEKVIVSFLL